jgi:hypothetical protein
MWRSAGFVVIPASSIREAIDHFQAGDFDLVLLGHSISRESEERLNFLIRAAGSHTPVVSISSLTGNRELRADGAPDNDSNTLLAGMVELLAERERSLQTFSPQQRIATKMV